MPTPRTSGIFKAGARHHQQQKSVQPAAATTPQQQENDLLPERCASPEAQQHKQKQRLQDTASDHANKQQQLLLADACHADSGARGGADAPANNILATVTLSTISTASAVGHTHPQQSDAALMDFFMLLQQTQSNLQDMLVDLETAKVWREVFSVLF